ncbi:MAG: protoheme IX farnesyltransferase, partial [Alphaproteobacteria bacterium CG11_big_fil_rev_8_21_14_0_20_44_7]
LYLTTAILLNFGFIYYSIMCLRDNTNTYARKTFLFSIIFLFLLYLIFVADKIVSN